MTQKLKTSALLLFACLTLLGCGEAEDTQPGQPVAHRRQAFKDILKAFEPMGVMLRTKKFNAPRFKAQADQLLAVRGAPWDYFKPDTQYPPSRAQAEVWSEPAKFAAAKQAFYDATDKLATVAAANPDKDQAAAAYKAVTESCHGCHETFRMR